MNKFRQMFVKAYLLRNNILIIIILILIMTGVNKIGISQEQPFRSPNLVNIENINCGDERTDLYFPLLAGKKIGVACNHSSMVSNKHLIDTLLYAGFDVQAIFSPEHGYRGDSEAGAEIRDGVDHKTGIKIVSLYGPKKKPSADDLAGLDVLLFDIQDVGTRFYTYIYTLSRMMEAAAENNIPVIVLDRPNPNGFYVDGPILDTNFRSDVGIYPIPIVYGMTIGEFATMVNGEGWLHGKKCDLTVIPLEGYDHHMIVKLDCKPSPNLSTWQSIYLYPSLCLFEGTLMSIGRGTDYPFQVIGSPSYLPGSYTFKPRSIPGIADHPPYENRECYGLNITSFAENFGQNNHPFMLDWLVGIHDFYKDSTRFFNSYFDKLAGTDRLRKDILQGKTAQDIKNSWEADLQRFYLIRKKYLIYAE
jgi:uncharacterized protein YbbC (DUF1343 family)